MANWWETDPVADAMPKADEWWSNDPVVGATKPPPPKDRGWGEAAADFGVGVAKGVVGMAKLVPMAVGAADTVISKAFSLGDPVTGGALANPATRALDDAQKYLQTKKSDYIQGKEAQADSSSKAFGQKFEDVAVIGGVPVGKIAAETVASFGQYLSDPSLLVQGVSENLASIIPSGLAARGTQAAAESLIPKIATSLTEQTVSRLARTAGVAGGISTGAVQQGSDVASEAYGKVMELSDEIWQQNPRYVELAAQVGDKKAKDQIAGEIATEAGVKSGIQSLVVNAVGAKFGGATLESAFLKPVKATDAAGKAVAGSSLKGFAKGGLGEAVTEAPEEGYGALVTNQAVAQIDPTVDIYQGVGSAAGKGAATAFGMGSVAGAREGMAAGLISRQRAQAEGALKQATDAGSAAAAANELAGSVDSLTMDVDAYLGRAVQGPASAVNVEQELGQVLPTPLGAPAQTEADRIAELRAVADRNAELMGQADAAGTAFDRRMALEQAEVSLGEAAPLGPRYADLTPMNERQASTRLAVMRDMAANEGGNALELAVVPHPGQAGMFAIGRQAVPSLDTQPGAPAPLAAGEAQARIEAADLVGKQAERRAEDAPRLAMVDRAKANIEARGGVASPYEAEVLRQANAGRPYDRIDPSLGRAASTDEKLSAATGIAVGSEAGLGNRPRSSETVRPPAAPFQYDRTTQGRRRETSTPPVIDTVSSFVGAMRRENTPAAQAFVREYEAGRITDADVQTALQVQQRGAQTPSQIIEQAANQAPRPQGGLQVEQSSAPRAITPTLAEAVTLYGGKPYTQSDLTAEGSTSRLSTAASIAPDTTTDGVQVEQGLAPRNEFAGRQATVTSANKALPPRPQRIQNQPTGQLTDAQLEQIASNGALPAISRRGASIELEARRLEQQSRGAGARRDADQADVQGRLEAAAAEGGRLAQPTGGRIITTGAKLSTQRQPVPGSKGSVNDQGTGHEYTVVDASRLGATGRLLQQIARIFGKRLVVFTSETLKADGFVLDGDNRTIYINANAQMSPLAVFGHELTHLIKRDNPRAYAAIQAVVERELGEGAMQQFEQEYGAGANLEELTSDLVGNRFQEASFWRDVFLEISAQQAEGAKGVIARLANSMNRAINAFLKIVQQPGFQADQYVKDLNAIKSAVKSAMVDYAQGQRGEAIALDQEAVTEPTPSDAPADITASPVRKAAPDETEISTQNPQGKSRLYDPLDDMLSIDEAAVREAMALPTKSGKVPLEQRTIDAILSYGFVPTDTPRDKAIEVFKQNLVSNLLYLYNQVPKAIRERSKLWYDGANRIATDMGKVYGVRMEQVAGIMAAMSPQKDWFQNVSMAERALDILTKHGNKAWDDGMLAYAKSYVEETRDRKEREKRQKAYDRAVEIAAAGTSLDQMSIEDAAVFIRAYDEAYHARQYRIVTPEGGFGGLVRNEDGTPSTMMWSTYDPIAKSVSIFRDGSRRNISERLGEEHKIRSFYNNIAAPNSPISHVTIDTHAVAAGLFEALAGTDTEVTDNFGGTGGSSLIGVGGTYGIIADAYRTAAKMVGVQAREMQSITWEAVRGLFGENIKSSIKPKVKTVWQQFKDGKLSFSAARRAIVRIAEQYNEVKGGVRNPDWVGTGAGDFVAAGGTSYDKDFTPPGGVRLRQAKELREKVTINLSAATSSIPGLKELYSRALRGESEATTLLQRVAESSLRFMLGGTKARFTVQDSTGVYMSDREPSISIQVAFDESESAPVLAALARFAESYNQQQIHVRQPTIQPLGHEFGDNSYATAVYEISLNRELSNDEISAIIEDSGLKGFTVTAENLTAYWVQPTEENQDADDFQTFKTRVTRVQALAGQPGGRPKQKVERLFVYGEGPGARIPYTAIRGDVRTKSEADLETPRLIAEYLNRGPVKAFKQKPLTAAQVKDQRRLADVFEQLPTNDLGRPIVRRAYDALAQALNEQFSVLPIKVEVMASVEIDGRPYAYSGPKAQVLLGKLVDDGLTADQARRAVQYLQRNFGTPSQSWRTGPLASVKAMDGEPYANSAEMRRDVSVNNQFRVYKTSPATFGPPGSDFSDHPLLQDSGLKDINGYPMLYNDVLRAVHDYFAHNISATQFGPTGEAAAWRNHMASTPDPLARWALTAETRLQNAWQNFRPGVEDLPLLARGFADQKAALPPAQYTLTGDAEVDAPMQAFIDGLSDEDKQGSLQSKEVTPSRQRNVEDISRDELAGRRVKMDVLVEDTGETATMTLDAKDALDDVDERESVMQRLLGCLRK